MQFIKLPGLWHKETLISVRCHLLVIGLEDNIYVLLFGYRNIFLKILCSLINKTIFSVSSTILGAMHLLVRHYIANTEVQIA